MFDRIIIVMWCQPQQLQTADIILYKNDRVTSCFMHVFYEDVGVIFLYRDLSGIFILTLPLLPHYVRSHRSRCCVCVKMIIILAKSTNCPFNMFCLFF